MASITMAASFAGATTAIAERPSPRLAVVRAAKTESAGAAKLASVEQVNDKSNSRRAVMFAAAAAAVTAISRGKAMAEDEPRSGTEEAKKKYASICVTMPTARICRK